jgi:ElaB/YqjD/DUF883 family membrane-anchored ribosome-binding protein
MVHHRRYSGEVRMDMPTDKLMQDLRAVVSDAEDLLKATAGQSGERVDEVRMRVEESLRAARSSLQEAGSQLEEQVRQHPWAAVGVAAGIGLLVGVLLGRK